VVLLKVKATDVDKGLGGELEYLLSHGDLYNQFVVDPTTGHIIVVAYLDREKVSNY